MNKPKEFKRWFDKSKVTSNYAPYDGKKRKEGSPLLTYHGTKEDFDEFKKVPTKNTSMLGDLPTVRHGWFFTPHKKFAEKYAGDQGRLIKAYLSLQNPVDLRDGMDSELYDQLQYLANTDPKCSELNTHVTDEGTPVMMNWVGGMFEPGVPPSEMWQLFDGDLGEAAVEALKKLGYDGAILSEFADPYNGCDDVLSFVAFYPGQIKATDSRGWNVSNPKFSEAMLVVDKLLL